MNTCEDYPCCGHEFGDCNGSLYGSDESIMATAYRHAFCEHEAGFCEVEDWDDPEPEQENDERWDCDYEPQIMEY